MNWEQFLADHGIEYVTHGPNTKRGEVSVKCPWCGDEDPSQHMGINLTREVWGCHRDAQHRGKAPQRLIQALIGCSSSQAKLLLRQYGQSDPDELEGAIAMLTQEPEVVDEPATVTFPPEFRSSFDWSGRFYDYLEKRGFTYPIKVAEQFGLLCATTGRYKDRIIFPLYLNGLIGWTGRAITDPIEAPRYLASSEQVKSTVYGYELAKKGGTTLFIVEGPFDALKFNWVIQNIPTNFIAGVPVVAAVAVMGTSITIPQLSLLRALKNKYRRTYIFFDVDAKAQAMQVSDLLGGGVTYVNGWHEEKDPASMPVNHLKDLIRAARRS